MHALLVISSVQSKLLLKNLILMFVLLQKQPSDELKPVSQGRTSRSRKVMECYHVQIKKKGFDSYDGYASYSTGIDPKPMDSSQNN